MSEPVVFKRSLPIAFLTDLRATQPKPVDGGATADSDRVQALRGLACMLLVAFHVIGAHSDSGMVVSDDSWWRTFSNVFTPLRMPLFTFLSGFVYGYRPVREGQVGLFIRKKLIRLWLPLVTVTTIYYLATLAVPDATGQRALNEMWTIYFFGYVHFWFLQALILIFAAVLILERVRALATVQRFAVVLAVAFAASAVADTDQTTLMSWYQALQLSPFFLLGLAANRFHHLFRKPQVLWTCAFAFIVTMGIHVYHMVMWSGVAQRGSVLGLLVGATGTLTLLGFFPSVKSLGRLGSFSFAVYLFHPFFVAFTRKMLGTVHLTADGFVFIACLLAGLIGPVVLERVVERIPVARTALLGSS